MILNGLVVVLVLGIAMLWGVRGKGRGLFSSMITAVCVVVSGAVAFAAWEPLVYGFLLDLNEDMAWGLGLMIPFAVTLLITRLLSEMIVPKNLEFGDVENFVGGAVFGAVNGIVTVGIVVLALSFFRFGPALLGHQAIQDGRDGNLTYAKSLWIPADKITVGLYEHLSRGSLGTPTPLAHRMPKLYEHAAMQRMLYEEKGKKGGRARNSIQGDQFKVVGRYRVTGTDVFTFTRPNAEGDADIEDVQIVTYPDGSSASSSSTVEGFILEFQSGAVEESGQVVVGAGQLRLICSQKKGGSIAIHPFSIVATPEAGAGRMHRFPINTNDLFFSSVGGGSKSYFTFEFAVPSGARPQDLLVKNYRVPLKGDLADVSKEYVGYAQRDDAIGGGDLFASFGLEAGGATIKDLDTSSSITIAKTDRGRFDELNATALLPERWVVNKTTGTGGLKVTQGKKKDNAISGGQGQFEISQLRAKGLDRKLRVDKFASKRDTSIVQVKIKVTGQATRLGAALESTTHDGPPRLLDEKGRSYEAIGWIYSDGKIVNIRFTPGKTLKGLADLPSPPTASKRDQTIYLLFQPTKGVKISAFVLGKKQIASFQGGLELKGR